MKISCIILAGGNSSRIGKDKAFLMLNDKPLIKYSLDVSKKFFSDIIVAVKTREQEEKLKKIVKNVKIVKDESEVYSPIVGIKKAIKHVKYDYIFLLSCDMPFIRENTIHNIISRIEKGVGCIAYAWSSSKYEPFCAIYRKDIFDVCSMNDSLHHLIDRIKDKVLIPITEDKNVFFNVNRESDLVLAKKLSHFR